MSLTLMCIQVVLVSKAPIKWSDDRFELVPVVEAVLVGSGVADGFTGNGGGVGGLACSGRLPHTYIHSNKDG